MSLPAFTSPLTSTTFLSPTPLVARKPTCPTAAPRRVICMAEEQKKPLISLPSMPKIPNPFAKKEEAPPASPVDVKEGGGSAVKLPVTSDKQTKKRGLDLLREDVLKSAPEIAGVGRQDVGSLTMKPMAGEPGYKPESYQTVKVSELGISPFQDDKNYVSNVGGVSAVKKAAIEAKKGKSASAIKKEVMQPEAKKVEEEKKIDIPDYLKPLPEDKPRKGQTWKNYSGR